MNFLKFLYSPFEKRQKESNVESNLESNPPTIFQLNHHCFYEIFEYLNVTDLHAFGQTCKRMNKVAGEYYKQNFAWSAKCLEKDGIYNYDSNGKDRSIDLFIVKLVCKGRLRIFQIPGFNKFTPHIRHFYDGLRPLKYIKTHMKEFESIKYIFLGEIKRLNSKRVKYIEKLLHQLEILHIEECVVDGDFYDLILKYCKNLRNIYVQRSDVSFRTNGKINWLLQEYPKLERLHFIPKHSCRIEELREFFVRNPSIQTFSTDAGFLWDNVDIFLNSGFAFDTLELRGMMRLSYEKHMPKNILELLNQLYEQGFYKRLYIMGEDDEGEQVSILTLVKGLELLCLQFYHNSLNNIVQLTNLKELMLTHAVDAKDMEILANNLTKLQRLCIFGDNIDVIMPFIRRSLKLSKIKLISFYGGKTLNLAILNKERSELFGARRTTIYVDDDVFLATKWTTRNGDTNLSFIELRRSSSIRWHPHYYYSEYFSE